MPWTLHRHILKELLRLLALATGILVLVISFAGAVKPLSEGVLGPASLIKYVLYLSPTMLGFALPFAAAFAGTLVFSRLATDNELVACRAGGIGYGTVLLPVLFLGLVLMLGVFYLSNWVVPSFYERAASMVEKDLTKLLVRRVQHRQPVTLGAVVLYADAVDDQHPPPHLPDARVQPSKLIRLRGVAAGRLDGRGRLRSDATAEKADMLLFRDGAEAWVTLRLEQVTYQDADRGDLLRVEQWVVPRVELPNPLKDSPRFMSWPQLHRLGERPERFDKVRQRKQELRAAIASEHVLGRMASVLGQPEHPEAVTLLGTMQGEEYTITAPAWQRSGQSLKLTATNAVPVRAAYYRQGTLSRQVQAASATVRVDVTDVDPQVRVHVQMDNATVTDPLVANRPSEKDRITLPGARWPTDVLQPLKRLSSRELIETAGHGYQHNKQVTATADKLQFQITRLYRTVVAQLHERAALSVACMLVMLLSAVLSIRLAGAMPLVLYFLSFMPAVVVVVITHSGENMATDPDTSRAAGLAVLWSGDLILACMVGGLYRGLART